MQINIFDEREFAKSVEIVKWLVIAF